MNKELIKYFNGNDLPVQVWAGKYQYQGENTPDDMHKRMAKEFARIDQNYMLCELDPNLPLSKYGKDRKDLTEESIYNMFKNFEQIIPQGSIMSTLGTPIIASLSNCWVVPEPYDSYPGIMHTDSELTFLYKRRGGVGTGMSNLRPKNTATNNTAKTTTGAVSFMNRFSNTTREVAMNGRKK